MSSTRLRYIFRTDLFPTLGAAYHLVSQDKQQRFTGKAQSTIGEVAGFQANEKKP